jgi:hypothetical protein
MNVCPTSSRAPASAYASTSSACYVRACRGSRYRQTRLGETLARYSAFFALFKHFRGYVDFFLLQDLVTDDCSAVTFFMPFDDFKTSSVPKDGDTYREYRRRTIEFVEARNRRIDLYAARPV